ncbi:uncharacterized protein LOC144580657 [Callithrix jacchus]
MTVQSSLGLRVRAWVTQNTGTVGESELQGQCVKVSCDTSARMEAGKLFPGGQTVCVSGFAGRMVSAVTTQLCRCGSRAAIDLLDSLTRNGAWGVDSVWGKGGTQACGNGPDMENTGGGEELEKLSTDTDPWATLVPTGNPKWVFQPLPHQPKRFASELHVASLGVDRQNRAIPVPVHRGHLPGAKREECEPSLFSEIRYGNVWVMEMPDCKPFCRHPNDHFGSPSPSPGFRENCREVAGVTLVESGLAEAGGPGFAPAPVSQSVARGMEPRRLPQVPAGALERGASFPEPLPWARGWVPKTEDAASPSPPPPPAHTAARSCLAGARSLPRRRHRDPAQVPPPALLLGVCSRPGATEQVPGSSRFLELFMWVLRKPPGSPIVETGKLRLRKGGPCPKPAVRRGRGFPAPSPAASLGRAKRKCGQKPALAELREEGGAKRHLPVSDLRPGDREADKPEKLSSPDPRAPGAPWSVESLPGERKTYSYSSRDKSNACEVWQVSWFYRGNQRWLPGGSDTWTGFPTEGGKQIKMPT